MINFVGENQNNEYKMKKLFLLTFVLFSAIVVTSCGSKDDAGDTPTEVKVECSLKEINAPATGGEYTIEVSTTRSEWTAFMESPANTVWYDLKTENTSSSKGTVKLTVRPNDLKNQLEGNLVVKSGSGRCVIPVTVAAAMSVSPEKISVQSVGGDFDVAVSAGENWTVECKADWVRATKADVTTVHLVVAQNDEMKERTADVVVASGAESKTITVQQNSAEDRTIVAPAGYHLVWNDEFEEGTIPDPKKWVHEVVRVNNEIQTYTTTGTSPSGKRTSEIKDGKLFINVFKENGKVYSARMNGNKSQGFLYGWFEAKIKLPKGKGTWPAWWMMPANNNYSTNPWPGCGEIDIMEEVGYDPGRVYATIHCNRYNNGGSSVEHAGKYIKDAESEFHVYACEWTEQYLQFFVDGVSILKYNPSNRNKDYWPFNVPFFPILNVAWGGDWGGARGVDDNALPLSMEVEYVRIFQK